MPYSSLEINEETTSTTPVTSSTKKPKSFKTPNSTKAKPRPKSTPNRKAKNHEVLPKPSEETTIDEEDVPSESISRPQRVKLIKRYSPTPDYPQKRKSINTLKSNSNKLQYVEYNGVIRKVCKHLVYLEFEAPSFEAETLAESEEPDDSTLKKDSTETNKEESNIETSSIAPTEKTTKRRRKTSHRSPVKEIEKEEPEEPEEKKVKKTTNSKSKKEVVEKEKSVEKEEPKQRRKSTTRRKKGNEESLSNEIKNSGEKDQNEEEKSTSRKSGGSDKPTIKKVDRRRSVKVKEKEDSPPVEPEPDSKPAVLPVIEDIRRSRRRNSLQRTTLTNPSSALAIKQRIGSISTDSKKRERRSLVRKELKQEKEEIEEKKEEIDQSVVEDSKEIEREENEETNAKKTKEKEGEEEIKQAEVEVKNVEINEAKPKKATSSEVVTQAAVAPIRTSRRVSKPNRLYSDEFDIDKSVQNIIIGQSGRSGATRSSASTSATSSKKEEEDKSSGKLRIRLKLDTGAKKKTPPPSSNAPIIKNGVLNDYTLSKKPIIEDEETRNTLFQLFDDILLSVCQDGVEKFLTATTSTKNQTTKSRKEQLNEKRKFLEARKLEIQMTSARLSLSPTLNDEATSSRAATGGASSSSGKRRRFAPMKSDVYMYPTIKPKKSREEGEDPDFVMEENETKAQKARDYLTKEMWKEMEKAAQESTRRRERSGSETVGSQILKTTKIQKRMISLEEYMHERNVQNRPECGLKLYDETKNSTTSTTTSAVGSSTSSAGLGGGKVDDYFYHEMISDLPTTSESEEAIDIDDEEIIDISEVELNPSQLKEEHEKLLLRCHGDSLAAADQIEKIMARPTKYDGTIYTMEDFMYRAAEQSVQKKKVLDAALKIIKNQYILETTPPARNYNVEAALYTSTNANAQKLKNVFIMYDQTQQYIVQWAHRFFVENLPVHFLASYLVLLKHAKHMTSSYIGIIVKCTDEGHPWKDVSEIVSQHVSMKTVDPELDALNSTIHSRSMSDVVFLMISPALAIGEFLNKPRAQETIFKWLRQIGHPNSEVVRVIEEDDETSTMAEVIVENIIDRIVYKIRQNLQEIDDDSRIVLVGWGWTTYVAHRAALLTNGVSAIISLGFPVMSGIGRRGCADDDILLTYCPTLFVVGADGESYDNVAMKDLRTSMMNPSGLVVVGHANDQLLVTTNVLIRLGTTQKVIFRLILDKILTFLTLEETKWDRMKLFPVELNNIFNVEPMTFRSDRAQHQTGSSPANHIVAAAAAAAAASAATSSSTASSSVASSSTGSSVASPNVSAALLSGNRRATTGSSDEVTRSAALPPLRKKTPLISPALVAATIGGVEGARLKFQDAMLRKVQIPDGMPKRTISVDGPRQVEKGDLRERSLTTPVSLQKSVKEIVQSTSSTSSQGPIDPASISLS